MDRSAKVTLVSSAVIFLVLTAIYWKVLGDREYADNLGVITAIYLVAMVLLGVSTYYYLRVIRESFELVTGDGSVQVRFLTREETTTFLYNDADGYVATMSPQDLYARQSRTPIDYCRRAAKSAADFTLAERTRITDEALRAAEALKRAAAANLLPGLDLRKACYLPWVFAKTTGTDYEEGLPHSRAGTIFLNPAHLGPGGDPDALARTILHEKIHVFQRAYPEEVIAYLETEGYTRYKLRAGEPRIRANPDLSPWLFYDKGTGQVMAAYYTSDTPTGIRDVVLKAPTYEDPYEAMAYHLATAVFPEPI